MRTPVGGARSPASAGMTLVIWWTACLVRAADVAPPVQVQLGDGSVASGRLVALGAAEVRLAGIDGEAVLPLERVRAVRLVDQADDVSRRVTLTLLDGSTLSGDEFLWDGKQIARLMRPEGGLEIPAGRIRSVALLQDAAGAQASRWLRTIPEGTASDLVVVGDADSHEFVECAITAVSPDTVTVILDEETIPVKRTKVIGLHWLRGEDGGAAAGSVAVAVAGGGVRGQRIEWSSEGLVVDGDIRMPAAMLSGVDYASGRTASLAGMTPEKVAVEPWFGGLGRGAGLETFFAPRAIAVRADTSGRQEGVAATQPALIMRPRTVATWRLPADSRRFRAVVAPARGPHSVDTAVVAVAVDDRELFRRQIDAVAASAVDGGPGEASGIPIDVDLTGGRRLTVTVDFGSAGGIGGAILLKEPNIER